jgi:hypothetical protein
MRFEGTVRGEKLAVTVMVWPIQCDGHNHNVGWPIELHENAPCHSLSCCLSFIILSCSSACMCNGFVWSAKYELSFAVLFESSYKDLAVLWCVSLVNFNEWNLKGLLLRHLATSTGKSTNCLRVVVWADNSIWFLNAIIDRQADSWLPCQGTVIICIHLLHRHKHCTSGSYLCSSLKLKLQFQHNYNLKLAAHEGEAQWMAVWYHTHQLQSTSGKCDNARVYSCFFFHMFILSSHVVSHQAGHCQYTAVQSRKNYLYISFR